MSRHRIKGMLGLLGIVGLIGLLIYHHCYKTLWALAIWTVVAVIVGIWIGRKAAEERNDEDL